VEGEGAWLTLGRWVYLRRTVRTEGWEGSKGKKLLHKRKQMEKKVPNSMLKKNQKRIPGRNEGRARESYDLTMQGIKKIRGDYIWGIARSVNAQRKKDSQDGNGKVVEQDRRREKRKSS